MKDPCAYSNTLVMHYFLLLGVQRQLNKKILNLVLSWLENFENIQHHMGTGLNAWLITSWKLWLELNVPYHNFNVV